MIWFRLLYVYVFVLFSLFVSLVSLLSQSYVYDVVTVLLFDDIICFCITLLFLS
ncbi:MAG: hypothetical protein Q8S84_03855 [bacterium]|nr:hypothetical protein [bacterium]MDP3380654.1 hypothetical protein [bacterium]